MTDILTEEHYRAGNNIYRLRVMREEYGGESPRDWSNGALLLTFDSNYDSPDKLADADDLADTIDRCMSRDMWARRGNVMDAGKLARWARTYAPGEVLFVGALYRNDRSGALTLDSRPEAGEYVDGVAIVTRARWVEMMGADYAGEVTPETMVRDELETYRQWCEGEVYAFTVETLTRCDHGEMHAELYESLGDIYGDDWAIREARMSLPDGAELIDAP